MTELTRSELPQYFRPNFFANTPDILHAYLVAGRAAGIRGAARAGGDALAGYGIYSGFERCENVPLTEASEEYLNSEKYEIKKRSLGGPLLPMIARLNAVRRANPALRQLDNITFLETENEHLIAYLKRTGDNAVIACVNLDPAAAARGRRRDPARARVAGGLRRLGPARRRGLHVARRAATTSASSRACSRPTCCAWSCERASARSRRSCASSAGSAPSRARSRAGASPTAARSRRTARSRCSRSRSPTAGASSTSCPTASPRTARSVLARRSCARARAARALRRSAAGRDRRAAASSSS